MPAFFDLTVLWWWEGELYTKQCGAIVFKLLVDQASRDGLYQGNFLHM